MSGAGDEAVAGRAQLPALRGGLLGTARASPLLVWFREVDRMLLLFTLLLMAVGLVAVGSASPASARRYSDGAHQVASMYYFWRQLIWVGASVPVLFAVSMLPATLARRLSLIGACVFLVLLILVPFIGSEANGARRWIDFGVAELQPSEFLKPLFIVSMAWILSLRAKDPELPVLAVTGVLTALVAVLLMMQPDFGQTMVFAIVWILLLVISGLSPAAIAGLFGTAVAGVVAAYLFYDTARIRINSFLFPDKDKALAEHYQTDMAERTLTAGGWTGTGPGMGQVKYRLPEAHTDYIFSVVGEEFGLLACAAIAALYLAIVLRVLLKLIDEEDPFRLLAAAGLAAQFGVQAAINMAVNTGLAPSKGMTLPFISYGGSSMIALSLGMGLLLAFTRRNPYLKRSSYTVRWSGR
ncbi:FtsW/RodA/SpoVE family cell cycle protein [Sphingomonas canadensis]|uniref:Probable peptidoglycan glycosyltransferase FtsW n=1 Tax=Sphingomonas canadensis TaxID=1219257 RepID=A0ABW3H4E9_9SPHN|nr:putative peptidoglycan glycosyltransferase FtsW [Sphingomonas canadensis]MCW3835821.1 putative lipid II flippase FtsW [Sphingomonas canadensis]